MDEKNNEVVVTETTETETDSYIKFKKKYKFEDKEYDGIDMSGLEDLTSMQTELAQKIYVKRGLISATNVLETDSAYARIIAQIVTGLPIEFFDNLPARESLKIKNRVAAYFFDLE